MKAGQLPSAWCADVIGGVEWRDISTGPAASAFFCLTHAHNRVLLVYSARGAENILVDCHVAQAPVKRLDSPRLSLSSAGPASGLTDRSLVLLVRTVADDVVDAAIPKICLDRAPSEAARQTI